MKASDELDCTQEDYLRHLKPVELSQKRVEKGGYKSLVKAPEMTIPMNVLGTGVMLRWKHNVTGHKSTACIVDSGIADHKDLKNVVKHYSVVGDSDLTNVNIHGTHVAGTLGANGSIVGVAPNVQMIDLRIFDNRGRTKYNGLETALRYINDYIEATVVNLSLGSLVGNERAHKEIIKGSKKGILYVVAGGNEGMRNWNEKSYSYPAVYEETLAVGGVDFTLEKGVTTSKSLIFSRNMQIDVCADSVDVTSTLPGNKYGALTGTSMGTPCISGFACIENDNALKMNKNRQLMKNPKCPELALLVKSKAIDVRVDHLGLVEKNGRDIVTGDGFPTHWFVMPFSDKGELNHIEFDYDYEIVSNKRELETISKKEKADKCCLCA